MRLRTAAIVLLLPALVAAGTPNRSAGAEPAAQGWPQWGRDASRTHEYPLASTHDLTPLAYAAGWTAPMPNGQVLVGDVHAAPGLEVVLATGDRLIALSHEGSALVSVQVPGITGSFGTGLLQVELLDDFDGNGLLDIVVRRKTSDTQALWRIYDGNGTILASGGRTVASDGHLNGPAARFVQSGRQKLAFFVVANFGANPRGVAMFDVDSGAEDFLYRTGGFGGLGGIGDVDGDGLRDLLVGSVTTHNGGAGAGVDGAATPTNDSALHLVVLDELGNERFTNVPVAPGHPAHEHGGVQGTIVDLDGDGSPEVVAWTDHDGCYPGQDMLYRMDAAGSPTHAFHGPTSVVMRGVTFGDLDGDGAREVVVGYDDGLVRVLGPDLALQATFPAMAVKALVDLDGRGGLDIVVVRSGGLAVVDYPSLATIWRQSMPVSQRTVVVPSDLDGDGLIDLLVAEGSLLRLVPVFRDADGDGLTDAEDACPYEDPGYADADHDGCTDTAAVLPEVIQGLELPPEVAEALMESAEAAAASVERGAVNAARGQLQALIHKVRAQAGKSIPTQDAALLIEYAESILRGLPRR